MSSPVLVLVRQDDGSLLGNYVHWGTSEDDMRFLLERDPYSLQNILKRDIAFIHLKDILHNKGSLKMKTVSVPNEDSIQECILNSEMFVHGAWIIETIDDNCEQFYLAVDNQKFIGARFVHRSP